MKILSFNETAVSLEDCPIGLFYSMNSVLCMKTEYRTYTGAIEAYIIDSGEFFWGDKPQTVQSQINSMVYPVTIIEE